MAQACKAYALEEQLLGRSRSICSTRELIRRVGRSDAPVLLLGETGTGKEVVARAIHGVSGRVPFVPIDCSALATPLLESELFGYMKGAFTGATSARRGLAEAADGGTAFFDEIGELPLDQQAKLLRLLQEKEFRPLGGTVARKSDFRVIAATNLDLAAELRSGHFRGDLYYRLKVVTIVLPPLHERTEDIPLLAQHFLHRFGGDHTLSPEVMQAFLFYPWPGNVRELANCVQGMVALADEVILGVGQLPDEFRGNRHGRPTIPQSRPASVRESATEDVTSVPLLPLTELERMAVSQAFRHANGNCGEAARLLGIGRTTLYRKLKEYRVGSDGPTDNGTPFETGAPSNRPVPRSPRGMWRCARPPSLPLAPFVQYTLPPRSPAVEMMRPQEIEFAATRTLILSANSTCPSRDP